MIPEIFNARVAQREKSQKNAANAVNEFNQHQDNQDNLYMNHLHRPPDEYSEVLRSEKKAKKPWKAFSPKPIHVFFDSQHSAEKILLLLRKHPLTQVPKLLGAALFGVFPLVLGFLGLHSMIPANYMFATYVLWYLFLVGFLLETFLTWFFHVFIITDERIIDVDFLSLIYKRITAAKIDNIEDITTVTGGAIRSVFNFGTVKIQTAGARPEIAFEDVPQPSKVKRLLNELILEEEREKIEGRVH